jgi:ribosomal protein S1
VRGSVRRTVEDPWPEIHRALPPGTELHGSVSEVNENCVRVALPNGLQGIVPRDRMQQAGFEYADYTKNVVIGQGLDVVVTKVFLSKRKIRLDLKRNVMTKQGKQTTPNKASQPASRSRRG